MASAKEFRSKSIRMEFPDSGHNKDSNTWRNECLLRYNGKVIVFELEEGEVCV
jgi:hypothetical protein